MFFQKWIYFTSSYIFQIEYPYVDYTTINTNETLSFYNDIWTNSTFSQLPPTYKPTVRTPETLKYTEAICMSRDIVENPTWSSIHEKATDTWVPRLLTPDNKHSWG